MEPTHESIVCLATTLLFLHTMAFFSFSGLLPALLSMPCTSPPSLTPSSSVLSCVYGTHWVASLYELRAFDHPYPFTAA